MDAARCTFMKDERPFWLDLCSYCSVISAIQMQNFLSNIGIIMTTSDLLFL